MAKICTFEGVENELLGGFFSSISKALSNPNYTYSTEDIEAGNTALETGKIYIVYE